MFDSLKFNNLIRYFSLGIKFGTLILALSLPVASNASADGEFDPTFGVGGRVTDVFPNVPFAAAVAVQQDQKIVAVGGVATVHYTVAAARFLSTGALDPEFGTGGKVLLSLCPNCDVNANRVLIQPADQKIVILATQLQGSAAVIRLLPNGTLDPSFGNGGVALPDTNGTVGAAMAFQGTNILVLTVGANPEVLRLTPSGVLDTAFGVQGKSAVNYGTGLLSSPRDMAVAPDGSYAVVGGSSTNDHGGITAYASYTAAGALIGAPQNLAQGADDLANNIYVLSGLAGVVALPDNSFVALGAVHYQGLTTFHGQPTTGQIAHDGTGSFLAHYVGGTFVSKGEFLAPPNVSSIAVHGFVRDSSGRFYTSYSDPTVFPNKFYLVRFTSSFGLDATFGTAGEAPFEFLGGDTVSTRSEAIDGMDFQADGNLIVSGLARTVGAQNFGVARIIANGLSPIQNEILGFKAQLRVALTTGSKQLNSLLATFPPKQKTAQKTLKTQLTALVKGIHTSFAANHALALTAKQITKVDYIKLDSTWEKAVSQALKLNKATFSKDKKAAQAAFKAFLGKV